MQSNVRAQISMSLSLEIQLVQFSYWVPKKNVINPEAQLRSNEHVNVGSAIIF